MRDEFISALRSNQAAFGMSLSDDVIERLADYFELVQQHNAVLHLVGPSTAEEFATRHILESLTLLEFLPEGARFADVGTGAGLPSIPCLIARDDLSAVLIESKEKKGIFLREAIRKCALSDRATIINRQFSEIRVPDVEYVVCRALDKFEDRLERLIKWSERRSMLLFGGENLATALQRLNIKFDRKLLPQSERRFLFTAIS